MFLSSCNPDNNTEIKSNNSRDLSHNALATIGKSVFKGAPSMRSLQLDNNELVCLDENAFNGLDELEILYVYKNNNNNNINAHQSSISKSRAKWIN